MKRREFIQEAVDFLKAAGTLGASNMITGISTAFLLSPNQKQISALYGKVGELESEILTLEQLIEDKDKLIGVLSSELNKDDLKLDYTKHPYYEKVKPFENYLDDAIKKYSFIFPVNKLFMLALSEMESSLNPRAVSSVGAAGLWQFMPETARKYKLHVDENEDYKLAYTARTKIKQDGQNFSKANSELNRFILQNAKGTICESDDEILKLFSEKSESLKKTYLSLKSKNDDLRAKAYSGRNVLNFEKYNKNYVSSLKKTVSDKSIQIEELAKNDERFDSKKSTFAIVKFMADNLKRANGNYMRALSMYNADDTYAGIMPFKETLNHIDKVLHRYFELRRIMAGEIVKDKIEKGQPLYY